LQWFITLLIAAIGASWAVFHLSRSAEKHVEQELHKRYVTKDQFWEFKENFRQVQKDVGELNRELVEVKAGVKFLVERAKNEKGE
jgi:hypothetical protein